LFVAIILIIVFYRSPVESGAMMTMAGSFKSKLNSYLSNRDGNFAMMFAITSTLLVGGAAVAVDVAGMYSAKSEMQDYLDSAALAAVIEVSNSEKKLNGKKKTVAAYKAVIQESLEMHELDLKGSVPDVQLKKDVLTAQLTIPYRFKFGGVLNKSTTDIAAKSQVVLPGNGAAVEIALVLDNTESMNFNGKMTALKDGARDFINAIEGSNSGSKIALVPFARYVDIGEDKRGEPWLNVPAEFDTNRTWQQATHVGGTCHLETQIRFNDGVEETFETEVCTGQTTTYEELSRVIESRWIGCVGVRSNELHLEDDTYNTTASKIPGLLHKWPHEASGRVWDIESWCPDTVTPLTDDFDKLRERVNWLYGTDRTHIPSGLIWGRRILSPQAPFTEADTDDPKRQIMVLMSDGQNTSYLDTASTYSPPPYVQDLSSTQQQNGDIPIGTDEDTATLCESIKDDGTEMFTIAFQVTNQATRDLLQNCASSPAHYFDAGSNELLVDSFASISDSLEAEIRIIR